MPKKDEEFRTIPDFEEYEVNSSGVVRRKARVLAIYQGSIVLSRPGKGTTKIRMSYVRDLVKEIWPEIEK